MLFQPAVFIPRKKAYGTRITVSKWKILIDIRRRPEITVDFGDNLKRIGGIMNGGAICTLLDFAGGLAVSSISDRYSLKLKVTTWR